MSPHKISSFRYRAFSFPINNQAHAIHYRYIDRIDGRACTCIGRYHFYYDRSRHKLTHISVLFASGGSTHGFDGGWGRAWTPWCLLVGVMMVMPMPMPTIPTTTLCWPQDVLLCRSVIKARQPAHWPYITAHTLHWSWGVNFVIWFLSILYSLCLCLCSPNRRNGACCLLLFSFSFYYVLVDVLVHPNRQQAGAQRSSANTFALFSSFNSGCWLPRIFCNKLVSTRIVRSRFVIKWKQ